jgi:hypothetical protein
MTLELPSGRDLSRDPKAFSDFKSQRDAIDALRGADSTNMVMAAKSAGLPARASARQP